MKKYDLSSVGRDDLDPGVEAALSRGNRRSSLAHMTASQRKAKAREDKKAANRRGKRAVYDLDPAIIQGIETTAMDLGTTNSQVAQLALALFLLAVASGQVDPADYKQPVNNPRYTHILKYPPITV